MWLFVVALMIDCSLSQINIIASLLYVVSSFLFCLYPIDTQSLTSRAHATVQSGLNFAAVMLYAIDALMCEFSSFWFVLSVYVLCLSFKVQLRVCSAARSRAQEERQRARVAVSQHRVLRRALQHGVLFVSFECCCLFVFDLVQVPSLGYFITGMS
jgi:4-hydroxybenzoate polyprenyltransferase